MEFDVVVVGAGSSGAVLASRLSEDSTRSVLLLEAGPDYPTVEDLPSDVSNAWEFSAFRHDWGFTADAVRGREIALARGKVVGGSSSINTGIAIRGAPADYDGWADQGNPAWSWERCLPYFRSIESDRDIGGEFHGTDGPVPVVRWREDEIHPVQRAFRSVCTSRGFPAIEDQNDPEGTGVSTIAMNRRGRVRWSTNLAYLATARDRPNLTIRSECVVDRVVFEGRRAAGVVMSSAGATETVRGREIVISAGAIQSPAILVRSGIGPAEELARHGITPIHTLEGVGKHLMDHPLAPVICVAKPGAADANDPLVQVLLRYTSDGGEFNDMQMYLLGHLDVSSDPTYPSASVGRTTFGLGPGVQLSKSIGTVQLMSRDPRDRPRITLNFVEHEDDLRRLREGVRLAWDLATSEPVQQYHTGIHHLDAATVADDERLNDYIRQVATNMDHPVCTCRMGPSDDPGAVVDEQGRVHGLVGLRVVDGSIMPTIIRANTNLTCIVIGERVAEWMRDT